MNQTTDINKQFELNIALSDLHLPAKPSQSTSYQNKAFELANRMNDTSKLIKAYICKGNYHWHQTEFQKLTKIQDTIYNLSRKTNNKTGLAAYYRLTGLQLIDEDKLKKAYSKLTEAKKLYTNAQNPKGKANTLHRIGIVYWRQGNYDSTLYYYNKAHEIFKRENYTYGIGEINRYKGIVYKRTGDYPKALDAFYQAEKYFTKTGMPNQVAEILGNIGNLHIKLKNYQRALEAFNKSLEKAQSEDNQKLIAYRFHSIGFTYFKMDNYNKADSCFNRALKIYNQIDFDLGKAELKLDMGKLYYKLEKYPLSIQHLKESINTFKKKNYQKGLSQVYQYLGKNECDLKNYPAALKYIQQAIKYNSIVKDAELKMELYQLLSDCHKNAGNFKEAYKTHVKFHNLQDSLSNIKTKEKIARIQNNYKTEKREQEIENLINEKKIESQRFQRNLLLVTFILLLIIAILIYNGYRNKKKNIKILQKVNREMKSAKERAEKAD
ncbi:MAG: tetratricopeptide repeat protein, partial [Bacteroidota bacterium]